MPRSAEELEALARKVGPIPARVSKSRYEHVMKAVRALWEQGHGATACANWLIEVGEFELEQFTQLREACRRRINRWKTYGL